MLRVLARTSYGKAYEKDFGLDPIGSGKLLSVFEQGMKEDRRKERS